MKGDLVRRQTYPEYYYPKNPHCLTPVDFSGDEFLKSEIAKKVRIAPSHLAVLQKGKKAAVIDRLNGWLDYVQKILPSVIHPAVLRELFSTNLIINIYDYNVATLVNPSLVGNIYGSYLEPLNTICLFLPTFCTEDFVREIIINELIGVVTVNMRELASYNPLKLPALSLGAMRKQSLHAYKMGLARINTFAQLLNSAELTRREQRQLQSYLEPMAYYSRQPFFGNCLFFSKDLLAALHQTGQWQKFDGGSTWNFIDAKSHQNTTFYSVSYDPHSPKEETSDFVMYQTVHPREFVTPVQRGRVFTNNMLSGKRRHGDPLAITVKKKNDARLQLYLLNEAFSDIFEYPFPIVKTFFPELCRLFSTAFCLPGRDFCDQRSFPVVEIITNGTALLANPKVKFLQ